MSDEQPRIQNRNPSLEGATTVAAIRDLVRRYHNVLIFLGGFLFDFFTVGPVDSWIDISIETAYLTAITFLLVYQHREAHAIWKPSPWCARLWRYNLEAMHFLYGGLLSINVVIYFRSTTGARPIIFFALLILVMILNEVPRVRAMGYRLRLGLYALCIATALIYLVPLAVGAMGDLVFLVSMALSAGVLWRVSAWLAAREPEPAAARKRLFAPGAAVIAAIIILYFARLVPPVPLSVQGHGIYHEVQRTEAGYVLRTLRPPLYLFWRRDDRPFQARPGDRLFYFVRVFAPAGFEHQVAIRWERWSDAAGRYVTTDRVPLTVVGGRALGFRGYALKQSYEAGRWRVGTETADGRTIGQLSFNVVQDVGSSERRWRDRLM